MRYLLTIADTDDGYCNHFFNYITANESKRVKASYITEADYAVKAMGEGKPIIDILLISIDLYKQIDDYANVKTLIVLSDGRSHGIIEERNFLNKYQAADILIEEAIRVYMEENPLSYVQETKSSKTRVIGIYSPVTRCGKTLNAVVLSRALAKSGKNVFYLNTEDFSVAESFFKVSEINQMSDILYYAKNQRKDIVNKIIEKVCPEEEGRLFSVSSAASAEDMLQTSVEAWEFLLQRLQESGNFDYIIVDFQSKYDEMTTRLLELCNAILFLVSREPQDVLRITNFFRTLENTRSSILQIPHIKVLNQYAPGLPYEVPEGGKGIPFIQGVVNKGVWPYEVDSESVMGRILLNTVNGFSEAEWCSAQQVRV